MIYARKFTIESCHFNDSRAYAEYAKALGSRDGRIDVGHMRDLLESCHGHTFLVDIVIENGEVDDNGFIVDDQNLERLVNKYNRTNLSVHPAFTSLGWRATTERFVQVLMSDVHKLIPRRADRITVAVSESPTISASETWTKS